MTKLSDIVPKKKQREVEEADARREAAKEKGMKGVLSDEEREAAIKKMEQAGIPPYGGEHRG